MSNISQTDCRREMSEHLPSLKYFHKLTPWVLACWILASLQEKNTFKFVPSGFYQFWTKKLNSVSQISERHHPCSSKYPNIYFNPTDAIMVTGPPRIGVGLGFDSQGSVSFLDKYCFPNFYWIHWVILGKWFGHQLQHPKFFKTIFWFLWFDMLDRQIKI